MLRDILIYKEAKSRLKILMNKLEPRFSIVLQMLRESNEISNRICHSESSYIEEDCIYKNIFLMKKEMCRHRCVERIALDVVAKYDRATKQLK